MDDLGLSFFKNSFTNRHCFVEYGCGGSTSYAVNVANIKNIISVDSSKEWVDKVIESLSNSETRLIIKHCDIGPIGEWGTPQSRDFSQNFWRYAILPWVVAKECNLVPDLVLVDGRFRVACFLYSLLCSRIGTLIMFDDYFDRPQYFIVERFCQLSERHGRMAVFCVEHKYSVPDMVAAIAEYSTIWD